MARQPATRPDTSLRDARPGAEVAATPVTATARVPRSTVGIAAALAAAANVLVYLVGEAVTGGLRAPMGEGGALVDLPVVAVVLVSVVGTLAAAVALWVVQRVLPRRAVGTWLGLVTVGLLVSLAPMAQVPAESVPWLVGMHVVVAAAAVLVLGRRARRA